MKKNLVIAGNGFLGNNVLRELIAKGKPVKATVRSLENTRPFKNLDCEIIQADMFDKKSLLKAMEDVDVVYNCAAIYKMWAKDPQKEIIQANIEGARNIVEAAAEAKVKRLVFISSAMVQSPLKAPITENSGFDENPSENYAKSKIAAEKLAWDIVKQTGLDMISILPVGMIGPNSYGHIPPAMEVYYNIMANKIPFDPQFFFNIVHVTDVARTIVHAGENAPSGERYILGPDRTIRSTEVFELAHRLFPHVKVQSKKPRGFLFFVSTIMELVSKVTGKKPVLQKSSVKQFLNPNYQFDSSKAKNDLGWDPRPTMEIIEQLLKDIHEQTRSS
jgi:dihydroflavonol-4-reductase